MSDTHPPGGDHRERLKNALLALRHLQRQVEALEQSRAEPIAVIGIGCRFPGGAIDPEAFWRLLRDGVDAITEVPSDRWDTDVYYDSDPERPGKIYTRHGGFLENIEGFDPQFFGITPREAVKIDPQHRLILEVAWETLERAGLAPDRLGGTATGVFVGITASDYAERLGAAGLASIDAYHILGNNLSFAAGRLAFVLGLQGPALAVDTACSSSLTAVHLACQSLRAGECDLALAGGVNVILSAEHTIAACKARMLAPDGRCKTFDESADGFVRSEGCGMVALKRLSAASAAGDNVLAVLCGSAVNQDGPSSGLTVPNKLAQEALLRQALRNAGVQPGEVDYVEAHGTGTPLGDPIEVRALCAVLGQGRSPERPLLVGAVKTNVGHLESAAGIAGLLKVILSLQHRTIPPHLHLRTLSPRIDWESLPVRVPTVLTQWSAGDRRIAGVSAFGASGTNAHVVVAEAPQLEQLRPIVDRPTHLLSLSAKTAHALTETTRRWADHLGRNTQEAPADVCFTANTGRAAFGHRLAVVAGTTAEIREKLCAFSDQQAAPAIFTGRVDSKDPPKIAFLFTGQGSQYAGMGRQLFETQPTFRATLERCQEILRPHLALPLLSVLYPETVLNAGASLLDQTLYTQPALFAFEYALAELWRSWGVEPAYLLGHSVGEYAAACVAGLFSLEAGLELIARRAALMQALPPGGRMAAVLADESTVAVAIAPFARTVAIASINGPRQVVISGAGAQVSAILAGLADRGIASQPLNVSHAFHSPLLDPILNDLETAAASVPFSRPSFGLVSNLTGRLSSGDELAHAAYWRRHSRDPVRFSASINTLKDLGCRAFLEIGPGSTLLTMGKRCFDTEFGVWLASLRQGRDDWQQLLESLATLYVGKAPVDWAGFDRDYPRRRLVLPTYPFQRQRCWIETAATRPETHAPARVAADVSAATATATVDGSLFEEAGAASGLMNGVRLPRADLTASQGGGPTVTRPELYQVEWEARPPKPLEVESRDPSSASDARAFDAGSHWLLFGDALGVGQRLAECLRKRGQTCTVVQPGTAYRSDTEGLIRLVPGDTTHLDRVVRELRAENPSAFAGVIHSWALDAPARDDSGGELPAQRETTGCVNVLQMVQALVRAGAPVPGLWLLTRGAQPVGTGLVPPALSQAPLWGLGHTVALEHPEVRCVCIDLDASADAGEIERIADEILKPGADDRVAYRRGVRHVARLTRNMFTGGARAEYPPAFPPVAGTIAGDSQARGREPSLPPLYADATYLITGGLAGLGLRVARWMVERGAGNIVLMGRGEPSPDATEAIQELEHAGARIVVVRGDVGRRQDVARLLAGVGASLPSLRGIIHSAMVLDDGVLLQLDQKRFERTMHPKVAGTWNLHELTKDMPLDFFVLFSSAASVLGSAGQANYAAACAFQDALAFHRRASGLPALVVNWGPWSEIGSAARRGLGERLHAKGLIALTPQQGLDLLEQAMSRQLTQAVALHADWRQYAESTPGGNISPLLARLVERDRAEVVSGRAAGDPELLRMWRQAAQAERHSLLRSQVREQVGEVLGFAPSFVLDPDRGLGELGIDSLLSLELKNRLQASIGQSLPSTLVYDHPTVSALVEFLRRALESIAPTQDHAAVLPRDSRRTGSSAVDEIEDLSEDEAELLLLRELAISSERRSR